MATLMNHANPQSDTLGYSFSKTIPDTNTSLSSGPRQHAFYP